MVRHFGIVKKVEKIENFVLTNYIIMWYNVSDPNGCSRQSKKDKGLKPLS